MLYIYIKFSEKNSRNILANAPAVQKFRIELCCGWGNQTFSTPIVAASPLMSHSFT